MEHFQNADPSAYPEPEESEWFSSTSCLSSSQFLMPPLSKGFDDVSHSALLYSLRINFQTRSRGPLGRVY